MLLKKQSWPTKAIPCEERKMHSLFCRQMVRSRPGHQRILFPTQPDRLHQLKLSHPHFSVLDTCQTGCRALRMAQASLSEQSLSQHQYSNLDFVRLNLGPVKDKINQGKYCKYYFIENYFQEKK